MAVEKGIGARPRRAQLPNNLIMHRCQITQRGGPLGGGWLIRHHDNPPGHFAKNAKCISDTLVQLNIIRSVRRLELPRSLVQRQTVDHAIPVEEHNRNERGLGCAQVPAPMDSHVPARMARAGWETKRCQTTA